MNDKLWMLLALILVVLLLTPERQQMRRTPSGQTRPAPMRQTNSRPAPARVAAKFVF